MKLRISLAVAASILAIPTTVSATERAVAGCPVSNDLLSIDATVGRVDRRIYTDEDWAAIVPLIEAQDANGDGYLCSAQFAPNRGQDKQWGAEDYVITKIDDNKAVGRTPN